MDQTMIFTPYWDGEKAATLGREIWMLFRSSVYYGFTFVAFALALLSNVWHIFKKRDHLVTVLLIFLAWLFYTLLIYQIEYTWDSLENVVRYSYKRFLFSFVPLLWFYVAAGQNVNRIFEKIDDFVFPAPKPGKKMRKTK
jgi:carbon starvation protein CstA